MRADLNIVDLARLTLLRPVMQRDLPAGGRRLVQRADGYLATLVATLRKKFTRVAEVSAWLEPPYLDEMFNFGLDLLLGALKGKR